MKEKNRHAPSKQETLAPSWRSFFMSKSTTLDGLELVSVVQSSYITILCDFHSRLKVSLASLFWIKHDVLRFPFRSRLNMRFGSEMFIAPWIWDRTKSFWGRQSNRTTFSPTRRPSISLSGLQKSTDIFITISTLGIPIRTKSVYFFLAGSHYTAALFWSKPREIMFRMG